MIVRLRKTTSRLGRARAEYPELGLLWAWPKFVNLQMTDAEKQSFIAAAVQRAPGKRQIKPSAALIDLEVFGNDEEDDEDFVAKSDDSGEGESESSDVDEDESEGSDEEGEGSDAEEKNVNVKLDLDTEATDSANPICAICLNMRQSAKNELPMTCDGCGLVVHETCYLPDVGDETDSTHSLETTEPWFCEPCIYGLKEPPHCELCPNRFGAFKRSDIGGRWVHLLCALYTQGMTFGDVDNLMAISWQELDHRQFGRKSCSACNDRLQARTGIATNCEVGLCKEYFHITCAQR
ncbi:hypothetical protein WR25_08351 [Diploscapter pachys]|uniref:PHD-type domain-containing protein n=1 Tax=Diploscapter pachys TaxID=2018661 RepID=A0A2A2K6X8_9BILA|nr:hypothetical protein WR25_08351 [Diploscapter pachys]